jgi:hypothetical protein
MEKINDTREAELEAEVTRLRGFLLACRTEVLRVSQLLAVAEEKLAIAAPVFEAVSQLGSAVDKFTAAKVYAQGLEKKLEAEARS